MTTNTAPGTVEALIPTEVDTALGFMLDTETGSGNSLRNSEIYRYLDFAYSNGNSLEKTAINSWIISYYNDHYPQYFHTEEKREFFARLKSFIKELNPALHQSEETTTTLLIAKAGEAWKVLNQ